MIFGKLHNKLVFFSGYPLKIPLLCVFCENLSSFIIKSYYLKEIWEFLKTHTYKENQI